MTYRTTLVLCCLFLESRLSTPTATRPLKLIMLKTLGDLHAHMVTQHIVISCTVSKKGKVHKAAIDKRTANHLGLASACDAPNASRKHSAGPRREQVSPRLKAGVDRSRSPSSDWQLQPVISSRYQTRRPSHHCTARQSLGLRRHPHQDSAPTNTKQSAKTAFQQQRAARTAQQRQPAACRGST